MLTNFCDHLLPGRFDEATIEERREAALELLNFLGSQAHLFNSLTVQAFFEVFWATLYETQPKCRLSKMLSYWFWLSVVTMFL